ncbi:ATP-dependent DNA helicase sgs1 [Puccinia graminis f. sp. tritici]|uniref:DNA 3'-5' helicase n=1 Tax=Puccinia graminis f. sp. tritici TaxID=56615 RepID=A0A5B0S1F7_PUCGR|nr:ATP-dependent DNA helicase sgs1 [Puccinia graminis f. sp. tritici]
MLNQISSRTIIPKPQRIWTPTGINVYKKIYEKRDADVKTHIEQVSLKTYGQPSKTQQTDAVLNLIRGRNTFLLAGTGFGKSRIAELYYKMIPQNKRAVVLVLNPLDSLGDNQVYEKVQAGFTAINLTKMNFNQEVANEISNGVYQFVYMSPETFLNNKIWEAVYFSRKFQNRLALIVVDEAHMIYIWGLVESGHGKKAAAILLRFQDIGIFRPCYGNLGGHLLFRDNKPILLLSATCRPVAIEAIKKSLKLNNEDIDVIQAELTRPEIRLIRIPMEKSLASSLDLIKVFPSAHDVGNADLVPTLVYSGSRNRTLTVMEVVDRARETPLSCMDPHNTCVQRFHSCTGDLDKVRCVDQFANGTFPIISATMALGLGQNWKRVRMVAHMGRGDPAQIAQMLGRCGRDGRMGLGLMFVEKTRRSGKNTVNQFTRGAAQSDEDRIDALAITPVCLRIAFSMDNLLGYVPLWEDDPAYIKEKDREVKAGFAPCRCSNCAVYESAKLVKHLVLANQDNFDAILDDTFDVPSIPDISHKFPPKRQSPHKRKFRDEELAEAIAYNLDNIATIDDIRSLIGGQCFPGQLEKLLALVIDFKHAQVTQNSTHHSPKSAKTTGPQFPGGNIQTLATADGNAEASICVQRKTKKAIAAEKREEKAREKAISLERDRKRKEQVAMIMAQTWADLNDKQKTDSTDTR